MTDGNVAAMEPSTISIVGDAWILHVPRFGEEGTHYHTYGLLTPYFKGLAERRLLATRCISPACPISKGNGQLWLPPRADCPDCHKPAKGLPLISRWGCPWLVGSVFRARFARLGPLYGFTTSTKFAFGAV